MFSGVSTPAKRAAVQLASATKHVQELFFQCIVGWPNPNNGLILDGPTKPPSTIRRPTNVLRAEDDPYESMGPPHAFLPDATGEEGRVLGQGNVRL